jgi:Asp-tRNA(Asn)/Glu-tRNA(Gln) amidotransferase C subunit
MNDQTTTPKDARLQVDSARLKQLLEWARIAPSGDDARLERFLTSQLSESVAQILEPIAGLDDLDGTTYGRDLDSEDVPMRADEAVEWPDVDALLRAAPRTLFYNNAVYFVVPANDK